MKAENKQARIINKLYSLSCQMESLAEEVKASFIFEDCTQKISSLEKKNAKLERAIASLLAEKPPVRSAATKTMTKMMRGHSL